MRAYPPDFSPVEGRWPEAKTLARGRAPRAAEGLSAASVDAPEAATPDDIGGWFRRCGYQPRCQRKAL
jgi:hypothetical protein